MNALRRIALCLVSSIASVALAAVLFVGVVFLMGSLTGCQEGRKENLGTTASTAPSGASVRPVLYGYYGSWDYTVSETQDHATCQWASGWGTGPAEESTKRVIARLREARAANAPCVILPVDMAYAPALPDLADREKVLRGFFAELEDAGLIDSRITALYPMDEPDINVPKGEPEVLATNAMIRKVAAEFAFIPNIPLAVIYTTQGKWTGIQSFDWVGFDDYGAGSGVLHNSTWSGMKQRLRPEQRIILVPGAMECANVWDFYAKAQEDPQVVAILAFIWYDDWDTGKEHSQGLRSLGCRADYVEAAMRLKGAK
jgi:hypothetical protein